MSAAAGTLRVGVLGCGAIALRRTVPALVADPRVRVTAIASRDAARAGAIAPRFGAVAVAGYQALLDRSDVDAVYLPLPPALHAPWAERALHAGKHVLVEKPMAIDTEQAYRLAALAGATNRVLMECFAFPHHAQHAAVRRLVEEGEIGEPRAFDADFAFPPLPAQDIRYQPGLGGGALLDAGVYPLRAAQLHLGAHLAVAGAALTVDPATGVDVNGAALLTAPGGLPVQIRFGFVHSYRSTYSLWGSQGRITVERAFTPPPALSPVVVLEQQDRTLRLTLPPDDQIGHLVAAFVAAALGERDAAEGVAAAVRQAELVDAVREAASAVPAGAP